jgi:hypothetical protein
MMGMALQFCAQGVFSCPAGSDGSHMKSNSEQSMAELRTSSLGRLPKAYLPSQCFT